jgi:Mn-dependent DtxR family transcriptional regulator
MDEKQYEKLLEKLEIIQNLLVLIAAKNKATSEDIGKCMGVADSTVRKILAGIK